jgi:exosortase A
MTTSADLRRDDAAHWRTALPALALLLGVVLVAYRETAAAMVSTWSHSDTFAHAFLVPPIVVWLIWRRRRELAPLQIRPCRWMLLPMAAIAFAWLLGDLAAVNSVTELALVALLVLAVPAVLGLQVARVILFPLAFTFFAVPIGEFLLPQLMSWTADFTVLALRATGIPVFREGNQIVIPSGRWSVVEACSGVRYLIASFMVGTLFGYLHYRSNKRRWIFAAVAIAVPIVANWVRAYLIVLLGHLSNNSIAVGVDHLIYGWLFFGLVMGLMYAAGMWWSEPSAAALAAGGRSGPSLRAPRPPAVAIWGAGLVACAIAIAPHLALQSIQDPGAGTAPRLAALERLSGGWKPSNEAAGWKPAFHEPSATTNLEYVLDGRRVGVYTGYYRQQGYKRKLISSDNVLVSSEDPEWLQIAAPTGVALTIDGQPLTLRESVLRRTATRSSPEQRLVVWQVYWVAGKLTASDHWAKVLAATDRLLGRGDDAAVVIFYAAEDRPGDGKAGLRAFTEANLTAIVAQLQATRAAERAGAGVAANTGSIILER